MSLRRLLLRLRKLLCALRGHDSVLHFEGRRVMMRCTSCGHDSPGWDTATGHGPRQRHAGDSRRYALSGLRGLPQRRVS